MPTEPTPTPREAIIKLNCIRTDKGERPPEIDMAIRAINCCMIKRKPIYNIEGKIECPACGMPNDIVNLYERLAKGGTDEFDSKSYCFYCGQALEWR